MSTASIRCDRDNQLAQELLQHPDVQRVNRWIADNEDADKSSSLRRHLLTTSVRLSPQISPRLHAMAGHCGTALGLNLPLELYAYASPQYNAVCFKPEAGRLYIMFSSAILEAFTEKELLYVMGHEIGHHIYHHHDIPIGYILRGKAAPPADLALKLFAWSRYAEFSADRAGAFCANDLDAVARALFKLASGISHLSSSGQPGLIEFSLDEFLSQVNDMVEQDAAPGQGAPTQDWFSTHPFSPLRVKALTQFHESALMQPGGYSKDELEMRLHELMQLMEPGYLEAKTQATRIMRNLFIAAAMSLARLGGGVTKNEQGILQQFLGKSFDLDKLDISQLEALIRARITEALEHTTPSQRMQLVRDLALVARADEAGCRHKEQLLVRYARELGVPYNFVGQCMAHVPELD